MPEQHTPASTLAYRQNDWHRTRMADSIDTRSAPLTSVQLMTLICAPLLFWAMLALPTPEILEDVGWKVISVAILMLALWISEAIPIAATALLPVILFPLLNILPIKETTENYAHPLVFLFLGGFVMALAMRRWQLDRRIALNILRLTGTDANNIIVGFMIATAFLSMWMSNTATTVLMVAIATSIAQLLIQPDQDGPRERKFILGLMLAIAYAANIGGTATLIGTPPNAILAAYLHDNHGITIEFIDWMMIGLPFALLMLVTTWLLLVKILVPNRLGRIPHAETVITNGLRELGPMSRGEKTVLVLFVTMAGLWMFKGFLPTGTFSGISDTGIAIAIAFLCFALPVDYKKGIFVLNWADMRDLPWGVLILFGGGLALASAMQAGGVADLIGQIITKQAHMGGIMLVVIATTLVLFLTESMSNTALATIMMPVLAGVATQLGEPITALTIPAALAASCAFMLPMATPPNAIVFASGSIHIADMVKAGFLINLVSIIVIVLLCTTFLPSINFK